MPKFRDLATWEQAEQLMQPAFIRLIDNLRKQLEQSSWRGDYEETPLWSEGTSDEVKAQVMQLRSELAKSTSKETIAQIEQALADLPEPFPGYFLRLSQADRQVTIDLWELCYQICFRDYDVRTGTSRPRGFGQAQGDRVEVDTSLLNETGEVDWSRLDDKTRKLVDQIFANLPA